MTIICSKCKNTKVISCKPGLGGAQFPRYCDAGAEAELGADNCGQDPYVVLPNKSRFSDLQTLKLQVQNSLAYFSAMTPVLIGIKTVSDAEKCGKDPYKGVLNMICS